MPTGLVTKLRGPSFQATAIACILSLVAGFEVEILYGMSTHDLMHIVQHGAGVVAL